MEICPRAPDKTVSQHACSGHHTTSSKLIVAKSTRSHRFMPTCRTLLPWSPCGCSMVGVPVYKSTNP